MQVDKHISSLLFEHDCVIVPDFGGFVSGYAAAKVHPTQHVFTPPHKNITFNKHLKNNDGLLVNHIAHKENKTFAEANLIVGTFVTECNQTLKRGDKIILEHLGSLYLDVERNIQFEPDNSVNYLVEAFGMTAIQSLPIKREGIQERIEKKFTDREPIPQEQKRQKGFVRVSSLVTMLVVALSAGIIFLSVKTNGLKDINYSSLNPFGERMNPLYKERTEVKPALTEKNFSTEKISLPNNDTIPLTAIAFVNNIDNKLIVRLNDNVAPGIHKRDKTSVAANSMRSVKGLRYHIVSGCFKIEANAHNFVAMLKAKNLNAAIIGKNKDGLFVVSCGDYAHKEEAYQALARIRAANTEAWLYEQ